MLKKIVVLISLCLSIAILGSCAGIFSTASEELSFILEHTVFKTTLNVYYTNDEDNRLLSKRLEIIGAEIVEIVSQGEISSYVILSHTPITKGTIEALMMKSGACILDKNGTVVISSNDISNIKSHITYLDLHVKEVSSQKKFLANYPLY